MSMKNLGIEYLKSHYMSALSTYHLFLSVVIHYMLWIQGNCPCVVWKSNNLGKLSVLCPVLIMARYKVKASKNAPETKKRKHNDTVEPDNLQIELWSDIEKRQCSPQLCAICEFHGDLAVCDGDCHRHFHYVSTLGEMVGRCPAVVIAPGKDGEPWFCQDCKDKVYKCFKCGVVSAAVRQCPQPYYVRFYCPHCLPLNEESCPMHACTACKQDHKDPHLSKAIQCLRCPTTWHEGCFKESQRHGFAPDREPWQHIAHRQQRWMIYCPSHPIDPVLGTPAHDHISWLLWCGGVHHTFTLGVTQVLS